MGGRLYTYCWGRGRWEGDCIPIAGEEGDGREIAIAGEDGDAIAGEDGDGKEIVYLLLGKRETGGRVYTYCWGRGRVYTYHWGRGRWEGDCIPIAGEEGDRREIIYLLLGKRESVYLTLGKREMGGRLYTYHWGRGRLYT